MPGHCQDNPLHRFDGRNGASFFLSSRNFASWRKSLEFYRAFSYAAQVKKTAVELAYPVLKMRGGFSADEAAESVAAELELPFKPDMHGDCSAMISPTRDKAIIHRHGSGYEKIASGGSLPGVSRELDVYRLMAGNPPESFAVSAVSDVEETAEYVRFFMHYAGGSFTGTMPGIEKNVLPLSEFFMKAEAKTAAWRDLYDCLALRNQNVEKMLAPDDMRGMIQTGLVHRDFKPWNVRSGERPLFFDFEEAAFDGCPLEDLFNYDVDPMLRRTTPEAVWKHVRLKTFHAAMELLEYLSINISELPRCWKWYLLERTVFWSERGQNQLSGRFAELMKISVR